MSSFDPHGTTILCVRRNGRVAIGGDGQVTLGNTVMKGNARKVRRLHEGKVIAGFAGGTADAFTLFERFEAKLQQLRQPDPRRDRAGQGLAHRPQPAPPRGAARRRRRRATRSSSPATATSIEPEHDLIAIGSGGPFAQAAARALLRNTDLDARAIVEQALSIAADICIYTNRNLTIEELERGWERIETARLRTC